ncbi:hypothetical protein Avbf_13961 [Armadillidium vulgare]|nr:hypothetical protein Avbf_13961 [Armadillidium vulgare]
MLLQIFENFLNFQTFYCINKKQLFETMNLAFKLKAALTGFAIFKIIQVILQLCVLLYSNSSNSGFKYTLEFNLVFLIFISSSIVVNYEVIFSAVSLLGYIPFAIFLCAIKQMNIHRKRFLSFEDSILPQNSKEHVSIINMDSKFANKTNGDLFMKLILPMFLILMLQIVCFIFSLIIVDMKNSIRKRNILNIMPTIVRGNHATLVQRNPNTPVNGNVNNEIGNSYINNEILTNIKRSESESVDPPPEYDDVVSQIPESVVSFTPPPTYQEAKEMRKNNTRYSSSLNEGSTERNNL